MTRYPRRDSKGRVLGYYRLQGRFSPRGNWTRYVAPAPTEADAIASVKAKYPDLIDVRLADVRLRRRRRPMP